MFVAARAEHAHSGPGDAVRDMQQEGEEQVVPAQTSRYTPRGTAQEIRAGNRIRKTDSTRR